MAGVEPEFEETMKHEFGHTLQYRAYGGWGYVTWALSEGIGDSNQFERNADCRASLYFGIPVNDYGGANCGK